MKAIFFQTSTAFRKWLKQHHAKADAVWVGYYKKGSGKPSIAWSESVDEALCYGWIDGVRQSIDDVRYRIRFTPRKPGSIWSSVNIKRAQALIEEGRMQSTGLKAYRAKQENKTGIYSYEQRSVDLEKPYSVLLKKNGAAWRFFQLQPSILPKSCQLVDNQREEARNSPKAAGKTHREFGPGATATGVRSKRNNSLSAAQSS